MQASFHKPTLDDKNSFNKIIKNKNNINSESVFGTCYLWSDAYDINICIHNNIIFKILNNGTICYEFPKGVDSSEKLIYAMEFLKNDFTERKLNQFIFTELLNSEVKLLEEFLPNEFSFKSNRNDFEYIYDISDLADLKGKKYHGKRNHISKFNKLYNWKYEPIHNENKFSCLDFSEKWFISNANKQDMNSLKEYFAIKKAIENYELLDLIGGLIKVNDEIVAFTIGEKINDTTLLVHFEKALSEFEGAYTVINNEFCKHQVNNFKLINREEDMGIPGLRKSKLSYKPKFLIEKYNAIQGV